MTVVVTVKINDGIVLAGDSAASFFDGAGNRLKIYNNANKVFNLVKGLPIGGLTWGVGGIGSASTATITKDLRRRFAGEDPDFPDWKLDPATYTIEQVAIRVREFFFEELFKSAYGASPPNNYFLGYKVCGYSAGAPLPELWDVRIVNDSCAAPSLIRGANSVGPNWDGEYEAMDRLIMGVGSGFGEALTTGGVQPDKIPEIVSGITQALTKFPVIAGMPIQDAIDLAIFMVETSIKFSRFNIGHETVGGPIEVASITKHEGFKWVQRKLFYRGEMNPQ